MLDAWHNFKICGPLENRNGEVAWAFFGQRHDGAVFWSALTVCSHHDFWARVANVFQKFEQDFSHAIAPRTSYVPFKDVGVWFKDEDGDWHFK
jgi:hypothetical protein